MELEIGMTGSAEITVSNENIAKAMGSGDLDVFATPAMIALMERAATNAVKECLSKENSTVGTMINIRHIAATPLGINVSAKATLTAIDGKKLIFRVEAYDSKEMIGEGQHERFLIEIGKFIERSKKKLS